MSNRRRAANVRRRSEKVVAAATEVKHRQEEDEMRAEYNEAVRSFYVALRDMKSDLESKIGDRNPVRTPDIKTLFASTSNVVIQELCYKIFNLEGQLSDTPDAKRRKTNDSRELNKVKADCEAQKAEIESQREEIAAQKAQISKLNVDLANRLADIDKDTKELASNRDDNEDLEDRLRALRTEMERLREIEVESKKRILKADLDISYMKERLDQTFGVHRKLLAEKSQISMVADRLAKTNEYLVKDAHEASEKAKGAKEEVMNAKKGWRKAARDIQKIFGDDIDVEISPDHLYDFVRRHVAIEDKQIVELKKKIEKLKEEKKAEVYTLMSKAAVDNATSNERAVKLREQCLLVVSLNKKLRELTSTKEGLAMRTEVLAKELEKVRSAADASKVSSTMKCSKLESALLSQSQISQNHKEANKTMELDLIKLKMERDKLKADNSRLTRETVEAVEKAKPLQRTVNELQAAKTLNKELSNEVRRWQIEAAKAKAQLDKAKMANNNETGPYCDTIDIKDEPV